MPTTLPLITDPSADATSNLNYRHPGVLPGRRNHAYRLPLEPQLQTPRCFPGHAYHHAPAYPCLPLYPCLPQVFCRIDVTMPTTLPLPTTRTSITDTQVFC